MDKAISVAITYQVTVKVSYVTMLSYENYKLDWTEDTMSSNDNVESGVNQEQHEG